MNISSQKSNSMKKNFVYNFILTIFTFLYPLVATSIVIGAIGKGNNGLYIAAFTTAEYFVTIAIFGTDRFGPREIPRIKDNPYVFSKTYSEIMVIKVFLAILLGIVFMLTVPLSPAAQRPLLYILGINVFVVMFRMDWFFQGVEQYKFITQRIIAIRIIGLLCIIAFIHKPEDYIKYCWIMVLMTVANNITNIVHARKYVKFSFKKISLPPYAKKLFIFFLLDFFIILTASFDIWLLGQMGFKDQVTYLNQAKKINLVAFSVASAIATVVIPRASYLFKKDKKKFMALIKKSYNFTMMLIIFIAVCVIIFSKNIMMILGGYEVVEASRVLIITAPVVVMYFVNKWIQFQLLLPAGQEKLLALILGSSAVLSVILNLIFVPYFHYNAYMCCAVIMLIVEIVTYIIMIKCLKTFTKINTKSLHVFNTHIVRCIFSVVVTFIFTSILITIFNYSLVHLFYQYPIISTFKHTHKMINIIYCMVFGTIAVSIYSLVLLIIKDSYFIEIYKYAITKLNSYKKKAHR